MGNAQTPPSSAMRTIHRVFVGASEAFSIASTHWMPSSLFKGNEFFLYLYQEGPVGAVGNAPAFSKRLAENAFPESLTPPDQQHGDVPPDVEFGVAAAPWPA